MKVDDREMEIRRLITATTVVLVLVSLVAMPLAATADTPQYVTLIVGKQPSDPFYEIWEAVDAAQLMHGDVIILVKPGTYAPFEVPQGQWGALTIKSTSGPGVTFIEPTSDGIGVLIKGSYVTLGGKTTSGCLGFTIEGFHAGIVVDKWSDGSVILGNVVYDCEYGILVFGDRTLVRNNKVLLPPHSFPIGIVVGDFDDVEGFEKAVHVDDLTKVSPEVAALLADPRVAVPDVPLVVDAREQTDQPASPDVVGNTVRGNIVSDYFIGILVMEAVDTLVESNTVNFCFIAIAAYHTWEVVIRSNQLLKGNDFGVIAYEMESVKVLGNNILDCAWIGITVVRVEDAIVQRNKVKLSAAGNWLGIFACQTYKLKILGNVVAKNQRSGIVVALSDYVTITGNSALQNLKCGILLWKCGESVALVSNIAKDNQEDGITLIDVWDFLVRYNQASCNMDDGIDIQASGDGFVRENKAFYNRDWDLQWDENGYIVWTRNQYGDYSWQPNPPYPNAY